MRKLFYLFLLLLTSTTVLGQPTFNLRQNLGYNSFSYSSVVPVDSGYYLTAVATSSSINPGRALAIFTFVDSLGNSLWNKVITGDSSKHIGAYLGTLIQNTDSTFSTVGVQFGGWSSTCLFNYNKSGDTNYIEKFWNPLDTGSFTRGDALCLTNEGGFLIGSSDQPNFDLDSRITVRKLDSLGNEEWYKIYGSIGDYYYREQWPLLKNINGQIILMSRHYKGRWATNSNYEYQHQFWFLDSAGTVNQGYTTPNFHPFTNNKWQLYIPEDLIKTKDNGWLIATGIGTELQTPPPNQMLYDAYLYKLDSNFNLIWDKAILGQSPTLDGNMSKVIELEDSTIMAFGVLAEQDIVKGVVAKLSPQGDSLWARNYSVINNQADMHTVHDVRTTPDGGYILCGEVVGLASNIPQSGWLLKLDSMGCLVPGCHLVSTTQLPNNEQIKLKIYPNPATDYINLYLPKTEGTQNLHLHLYNLQGQLLQNHTLPQSDMTYMLSTEGLSSGAYVVQVLDDEGRMLGSEKVAIK